MENIIFGFGTDISYYQVTDILLYLLILSLILWRVGEKAVQKKITNQYMTLIRYGNVSTWWHHMILLSWGFGEMIVLTLFGAGALLLQLTEVERAGTEWIGAFMLWSAGIGTITIIQAVLIQLRNGYKVIFAGFLCIGVLSLYFPALPGSWLMYERCWKEKDFFSVLYFFAFQIGLDVLLGVYGYVIFKLRRNYGFSD